VRVVLRPGHPDTDGAAHVAPKVATCAELGVAASISTTTAATPGSGGPDPGRPGLVLMALLDGKLDHRPAEADVLNASSKGSGRRVIVEHRPTTSVG
jgi:hypothetical protein